MTLNETNHSKQSNRQRLLSVYFYQFISAQSHLLKLIAMSTRFSAESSQAPSRTHTPIGSNDADLFYFPPPIKFQVTDPDDHVTETCPPSAYDLHPLTRQPKRQRILELKRLARPRAKKMPKRPRRLPTPPSRPLPAPPTQVHHQRPILEELRAVEHAQLLGENRHVAKQVDKFLRDKEAMRRKQQQRRQATTVKIEEPPPKPWWRRILEHVWSIFGL